MHWGIQLKKCFSLSVAWKSNDGGEGASSSFPNPLLLVERTAVGWWAPPPSFLWFYMLSILGIWRPNIAMQSCILSILICCHSILLDGMHKWQLQAEIFVLWTFKIKIILKPTMQRQLWGIQNEAKLFYCDQLDKKDCLKTKGCYLLSCRIHSVSYAIHAT